MSLKNLMDNKVCNYINYYKEILPQLVVLKDNLSQQNPICLSHLNNHPIYFTIVVGFVIQTAVAAADDDLKEEKTYNKLAFH